MRRPTKETERYVANENAGPLPTPEAFSMLLAQLMSVYGRIFDGEPDARIEFEAKRMRVIEAYERAYRRK
jgi:hypothetical protein